LSLCDKRPRIAPTTSAVPGCPLSPLAERGIVPCHKSSFLGPIRLWRTLGASLSPFFRPDTLLRARPAAHGRLTRCANETQKSSENSHNPGSRTIFPHLWGCKTNFPLYLRPRAFDPLRKPFSVKSCIYGLNVLYLSQETDMQLTRSQTIVLIVLGVLTLIVYCILVGTVVVNSQQILQISAPAAATTLPYYLPPSMGVQDQLSLISAPSGFRPAAKAQCRP